jgi:hypothetical protein
MNTTNVWAATSFYSAVRAKWLAVPRGHPRFYAQQDYIG